MDTLVADAPSRGCASWEWGMTRIPSLAAPGRIVAPVSVERPLLVPSMSLPVLRDLAAAGGPRLSIAVIAEGGRLQDRGAVAALGWRPGDRLLITLVKTSAVSRRRSDGAFVMPRKPYVALPAAVRRVCRAVVGIRLLLVADPSQDVLVVHPEAAVQSSCVLSMPPLPTLRRLPRDRDQRRPRHRTPAAQLSRPRPRQTARSGACRHSWPGPAADAHDRRTDPRRDQARLAQHCPLLQGLLEQSRGDRRMDTIAAVELKAEAEQARAAAVVRRNSRGGRNAAENFVAAMRCLYKHLVNDSHVDERDNPAARVTKPRRNASTWRALPGDRIS
ncbi:hypothetical protein [Amycolatopsis nivea]|uniref:hypothetical protein n=1 Tax=Amycolatopsis nivea TaxID=1644109 RepID=UPI00196AB080|nr:hypothetical protein [Amycolatopsis nivea]